MKSRYHLRPIWLRSLWIPLLISIILLPVPISGAPSQPYVKKPIPSGPNAKIGRSWLPTYCKFYQREVVEAYKKHGFHNSKWDADAIKFLDHFTKLEYRNNFPVNTKTFFEEGKALIDAGCNDPMVLFAYGVTMFQGGAKLEAESPLERCIEGFKKSSYRKCRARWAPLDLADIRSFPKRVKEQDNRELCDLALDWTLESFRDGSYQNGEQRIALENFCSDHLNRLTIFRNKWSDVLAALEKKPPTDPYIDLVARAKCHHEIGWEARGGGFADTVTEEGWRVFEKELGIARKLLKEAWKLHPELPEAPYLMMKIARAGCAPGETTRMWFDRTVTAQMDYAGAYNELTYSKAKVWDNDPDGLYEFGIECVKAGRYDTIVPLQLIAVLKSLTCDAGNKSYWTTPKTIKYLDILYDGCEKSGILGTKEQIDSQRAATAWYCGRYALARDILLKLGDKADEDPFTRIKQVPFPEIKGEIFAYASPQESRLVKADNLVNQKKTTEALAIYESVSKIQLGDSLADRFVEEKARKLRSQSALTAGGWADLPLDDISKDWYTQDNDWVFDPDGWLRGSKITGRRELKSKSIFTQALELEVEVNFGDSESLDSTAAIGFLPLDIVGSDAYEVRITPAQKKIDIRKAFGNSFTSVQDIDMPQLCKLRMQIWAGIVNVYLNDKPLKTGYLIPVPMDLDARCRVVISTVNGSKGAKAGFRNLKVRKLTSKPSGMENVEPYDSKALLKQLGLE